MDMKLSDILKGIGRAIAYYPGLRKITGGTTATIFLCQFIYWSDKGSDPNGWIYKTSDQIEEETGLSYEEQTTARKRLRENGLLEERYARLEHQMYFRVCFEKLDADWREVQPPVREQGNAHFGKAESTSSLNGTSEITSETTTENSTTTRPPEKFDGIPQTPAQAMKHPDIIIFSEVTGRVPGCYQYQNVIETVAFLRESHNLTYETAITYLKPFWLAWSGRDRRDGGKYDPSNLAWLTEWAMNGEIPKLPIGPKYPRGNRREHFMEDLAKA